jgi:hypothetical protein
MPIQDGFGVWGSLGTLTPEHDRWKEFPGAALENNPTIRITYSCSDWNLVNSFAWLRVVYKVGGQRVSEPARRVYPRNEPLLIQFPVNPDFLERGVSSRFFEVKKQIIFGRFSSVLDIDWSMEIEELWG